MPLDDNKHGREGDEEKEKEIRNDDKDVNKDDAEEEKEKDTPKKTEKQEIIDDIIANDAVEVRPSEEETRTMFEKAKVINEIEFSFWELDTYLHARYKSIPQVLRRLIEIFIIVILFMGFPMGLALLDMGKKAFEIPIQILQNKGEGVVYKFVKINLFLTFCYVVYILVSIFADNILYLIVTVLGWLSIDPDEYIIETIQVINSTSWYWKQTITGIFIYYVSSTFFQPYKFAENDGSYKYIAITSVVIYTILTAVLFVEKFFMCFLTSEIRRKEYRNRIWDINYKTFVFKKLAAISEASPSGRKELGEGMQPDFDPGFYLKYNDLMMNSPEAAGKVAESIFGFLEVREIIYEDIEKFFPGNSDEVFAYLSDSATDGSGTKEPITFEELKAKALALHKERTDISRTLQSRDTVINKLDIILFVVSMYFSSIIVMLMLKIDYEVFLASVGPPVVAFGWIFSDTIKEIYNCFVFLLINHPYDFGDRVVISGEELYVSSVGLLSSTFVGINGRQVFIPTSVLFTEKIHNIRRSGKQAEVVDILISKTTTFNEVLELKDKMNKALTESSKSFTGEFSLRGFKAEGNNVKVSFAVRHQSNFQDTDKLHRRRVEFVNLLEREMKSLEITYLNSYDFSD